LLGAFILTIIGVLDDIFDLSPYVRILTTILAALVVVAAGIGIAYFTNPFGPPGSIIHIDQPQIAFYLFGKTRSIWVIADLFAVIWILWMANIVNWSKGLDGQMPGITAIAAIFIGLLSLRYVSDVTQWPVIKLATITAGAYLGFLVWNFYPQKIMPGYGGGSLAGYLLAVLAILSVAKVATMILILAIPTADAGYTIIRRLLRGKSPVWGDRGHLHHRLLDAGWTKPQIALFYWFTTALLGFLSLQLNSTQKLFTIAMITLIIGGFLIWLKLSIVNLTHPTNGQN
jgi:UDP-GlcNAc:undecaprenyl-phosphate GlcNAc-1-phosphate transferase